MIHLPAFIQDLGIILIAATIVTLLFKKWRQPVVLGYLVAGVLVGHHVPFLPSVSDTESVKIWAEIGVIFLLFGLGLEFSFKKLARVGKSAAVTAFFEVVFMLAVGYLTGQMLGWSKMDSIFLGGILSISSTTIIVRAFNELGLKGRHFVSLVFGVLIIEDLIAILLLALLSTIAATQKFAGAELILSSLKLGFFLILWFLVGIYLVPLLLKKVHGFLNDETTLVVSIGLCLLMVIVATKVGFSPALGAFIMGSILAETRDGHRIEHLLTPVRDLFGAIFFVSVGMLIDPAIVQKHAGVIFLVTGITIMGKFVSTALGALLSGQTLRHSVQAGMSLAQIGEFSFIIATLGLTLNVISDFLYPVAVAVSAITTFTTPYLIREADRFAQFLDKKLPPRFKEGMNSYQAAFVQRGNSAESGTALLWRVYGIKIALNSVMTIAITLGAKNLLLPELNKQLGENSWVNLITGVVTLFAAAPFLWGIVLGITPKDLKGDRPINLERLKALQTGVTLVRGLLGAGLVIFLVGQFSSARTATGLVLSLFVLVFLIFSRHAEPVYRLMEERFLSNLNDREREELAKANPRQELAPWNATLAEFVLSPNSELVGKTLMHSSLKERFGVTVTLLERGKKRILAPGRTDILMPFDRLFLIGTEEQLLAASHIIEEAVLPANTNGDSFGLESLTLPSTSPFLGKPIRDSGLREAIDGLIVGIERDGKRFLSPDSAMELSEKDLIWVVGNREKIKSLYTR